MTSQNSPLSLTIPVRYFDNIIGLSQWPGVASFYEFTEFTKSENSKSENSAILTVNTALQVSKYIPGLGTSYEKAVYSAAADREKYKQIYYQVQQEDFQFYLKTSLNSQQEYSVSKNKLTNFVSSNYIFTSAFLGLKPYEHEIKSDENLNKIAENFSVTVAALGKTNENIEIGNNSLFTSDINIPKFQVVKHGDTLTSLADISVADLATKNRSVPLNVGVEIQTKSRDYSVQQDDSLDSIAEKQHCTIHGLAEANNATANILNPNITLTVQNVTVIVENNDTFQKLVDKFNAKKLNVTVVDIAVANQEVKNIFQVRVTLSITDYIVQPEDTFTELGAQYGSLDQLATSNANVPNLFATGTALYLSNSSYRPEPGETLAHTAEQYGITVEQLSNSNAQTTLKSGQRLRIPCLVYIPEHKVSQVYLPYEAKGGETLAEIANKYNQSVERLAVLNQNFFSGNRRTWDEKK